MGGDPQGVFVLRVEAVAGPDNSEPDGRRHAILVFALAATPEAAEAVARAGLDQRGWIDTRVLSSGEITDEDAVPQDLRGAMARAKASGCALIVYEAP
ncbi:hypothetical protein [Phenylobacterium sp.]|uniref:hypothetical protein n=1 Tax=Phenylobacterium sp. TaxID=1871053 RepID=UPI0039831E8E